MLGKIPLTPNPTAGVIFGSKFSLRKTLSAEENTSNRKFRGVPKMPGKSMDHR